MYPWFHIKFKLLTSLSFLSSFFSSSPCTIMPQCANPCCRNPCIEKENRCPGSNVICTICIDLYCSEKCKKDDFARHQKKCHFNYNLPTVEVPMSEALAIIKKSEGFCASKVMREEILMDPNRVRKLVCPSRWQFPNNHNILIIKFFYCVTIGSYSSICGDATFWRRSTNVWHRLRCFRNAEQLWNYPQYVVSRRRSHELSKMLCVCEDKTNIDDDITSQECQQSKR